MSDHWRSLRVAADGTHHQDQSGSAAYPGRFDGVLPFHAPGLAPVRRGSEAWHIRSDGTAAYSRRFRQTFGFYEDRSAVETVAGWCHVGLDGEPIYADRYAWCGNVQAGRVPARRADGRYLHLSADGAPIAPTTWRYAGDYREGAAVVQRDDGLHGHVDVQGSPLHGSWFEDLDVFHKGLARAKDAGGWTHVDRGGVPISARRFAMVEPFYNGQARVERFDGAMEVIEPSGATVAVLREARISPLHALSADLVGYWRTEALATAVRLGVVDALPGDSRSVGARCGLSPESATRILRALWELGVVEPRSGVWTTTEKGRVLASGHSASLADAALEYSGGLSAPWRQLADVLRGVTRSRGEVFREVARDPRRRAAHHRMLAAYAIEDYAPLVDRLPVPVNGRVVDAGGGNGALARLVAARWPDACVGVLDLPEVVNGMAAGVQAIGADLFEAWPTDADVVVLARVLHDWDDADASRVLGHARAALRPGGRLCILEMVLRTDDPGGSLCDLHLLAVTGGRERTAADWQALLTAAGFAPPVIETGGGVVSLLVAGVA